MRYLLFVVTLFACGGSLAASATARPVKLQGGPASAGPQPSITADLRLVNLGSGLTECPQAGLQARGGGPLDVRQRDTIERIADRGDDVRANQDLSCFPQNETSLALSSRAAGNLLAGANDYRLGTGSSGFYSSTNAGRSFYDGIIPFASAPPAQSRGVGIIPSGGDPVLFSDREGVAYYGELGFYRGDDTNGVFVSRSTNGGFTWSRPCVPVDTTPSTPPDEADAACGATPGDARQAGDGRVTFNPDPDGRLNGAPDFDDKPYMTAGPRPAGVDPVCFAPVSREAIACERDVLGSDRLYATWTRFSPTASQILMSFSDDQARSWAPPQVISGAAPFCVGAAAGGQRCDENQYAVPTVNPTTGALYVQFENFNTPDENQMLVVRSDDGGETVEGPFFVTPVYDLNFPRAGLTRPDCAARGQQPNRIVYTNSCFRSNPAGNLVVDKRSGRFADDLYLVISDNRNGTGASSNADVFLFKSIDGGSTWIGPTRVNDDLSAAPPKRDCGREPGAPPTAEAVARECPQQASGNDQFWPWVDIGRGGTLAVGFSDRRLDTNSEAHEWTELGSRERPGNYLVWFWGAGCRVDDSDSRECLARSADTIDQPTEPVNPGSDPVPGQGAQYVGDFRNQSVSDVPSNYDYAFRAGIFAGDYNNLTVVPAPGEPAERAVGFWTDSRNGRSSRAQSGQNPICEQSDVFLDAFNPLGEGANSTGALAPFLVSPCPRSAIEAQQRAD